MNPRHHSSDGFTLFEMMIVLVILAMAMTVAPSIMAGLDGSKLRAASDEIIAQLRETRNQALRREAPAMLVLDVNKLTYATTADARPRPVPEVVDAIVVEPAALLQSGGIARITFQPDGTASEARISLRHRGSSTTIAVDWLTGRVHQGG